jgi:hypothetical protein
MKKSILIYLLLLVIIVPVVAQQEPDAGSWKTWIIKSPQSYRLTAPKSAKDEIAEVRAAQQSVNADMMNKINFWNAGAPGYRWYNMMSKLWMNDISGKGALANVLLGTTIYDATIVAWDTKYAYNKPRPYSIDKKITILAPKAESPSYPCEHSVAAGAAVAIISHFYPNLADSVNRMAQQLMATRVAAGLVYPSDTRAGFELGKQIALKEIEMTKDFVSTKQWDGKIPEGPAKWTGKNPMLPTAGLSKTIILDSASQFRPGPPPDFASEMEELRNFKQTFKSRSNAFYYASNFSHDDLIAKKIFEYNLHLNPPRAARVYAAMLVTIHDGFVACFEAKYHYWAIRPDQYDATYKPLMMTPPFPGYPSGHAMMTGIVGQLFPYFFPTDKSYFKKIETDGAESRFQAGIHFRSDNVAGTVLGNKVADKVIEHLKQDGADQSALFNIKANDLKAKN